MKMIEYEMKELIPIVAELTEGYTSKESTSITYDVAKQLMDAVIYCIEEYGSSSLDSEENQDIRGQGTENQEVKNKDQGAEDQDKYNSGPTNTIISKSGNKTAKEAYRIGYQLVVQKVARAKQLYDEFILEFNGYRNRGYIETVVKGMPAFFLYYDARYQPQNHILTLDYPTILPYEPRCGIDAIYQYLSYVKLEQYFLNKLPEAYVLEVLERYHEDHEDLLINICSILLRNLIGHMIAGSPIQDQGFKESDYQKIEAFVLSKTREELEAGIGDYIEALIRHAYGNRDLKEYLLGDVGDFAATVIRGAEHHYLDRIFVK
ncbi:MAG TPA: hypothetical protein GXX75_20610 [Clostridiales bacterium]|nr:hypothetical protein [Clostridiales bacterium]